MSDQESNIKNITEPIVIVQSTVTTQEIIMPYVNTNMSDESNIESNYHENEMINDVFINGIQFPLIYFNGTVLDQHNLESFALWNNDFIPQMDLVIDDYKGNLNLTGGIGPSNSVVLKLMAPIDGVYKKIELNFYINNSKALGTNRYQFVCLYKNVELDKAHCGPIELEDSNDLTTFEVCKAIALKTGLGFVVTEKCETVSDARERWVESTDKATYSKLLIDYMNAGGTNENEIFDCFIDLYNNITLIQVPWLFSEVSKLKREDFKIKALVGENVNNDIGGGINNFIRVEEFFKVLTNSKNADSEVPNNLCIGKITKLSKPGRIVNGGSQTTCNSFTPIGVGEGINSITTEQVQQQGNTIDDLNISNYATEKVNTCKIQMCKIDTNYQRTVVSNYFDKIRADQIEVELSRPNYGITRGTLVFILDEFDDLYEAATSLYASHSDNDVNNDDSKDDIFNVNVTDILSSNTISVLNNSTSDFYYIDKINFFYNKGDQEIRQHLILSKVNNSIDIRFLVTLLTMAQKQNNKEGLNDDTIGK